MRPRQRLVRWCAPAWLVLLLLALTACQSRPPLGDPEQPYPPERPPRVGDILHLPTGHYVERGEWVDVASQARVLFFGEVHDNPADHRLQEALLRALAARHPEKLALGMEMFTPAQQPALDRWVAGEIDERTFLAEVAWAENWRMDYRYYRPLLRFAREAGIQVIGLNAERDLVDALRRNRPDQLSPEQRERLPELALDDPYQRAAAEAVFSGHDAGEAALEGFLRIQTLWDEAMAARAADYLRADPERRLLVIAGGHHVRYGFGIPRRLFRRLPVSYLLVGTQALVVPEEKRHQLMDIRSPALPLLPYHFVAYTEYERLTPLRLGVALQEADEGVVVERVAPESNAARAGLQGGEQILAVDGRPVTAPAEVVYAVAVRDPGDTLWLALRRSDGERVELAVELRAP